MMQDGEFIEWILKINIQTKVFKMLMAHILYF